MACNGIAFTSPFSSHNFLQQIQISDETEYQQEFQGVDIGTMLGKKSMFKPCEDDLSSDELTQAGDKKRRLSIEQVRTLEKSFEIGNKLEPERKMQLARALGLLPRQVAIWFQNRRARWKNKKLEKDYDVVKRQIEAVRLENEALQAQNKRLQAEIWAIKGRETSQLINLNKEIEGSYSNRSEDSSEINLDISKTPTIESPLNPHQSISFFPTIRPPTMIQLFEESNRPELSCPKIQHNLNFNNLICGIDDQSQFWPWSDHHNLQ